MLAMQILISALPRADYATVKTETVHTYTFQTRADALVFYDKYRAGRDEWIADWSGTTQLVVALKSWNQ